MKMINRIIANEEGQGLVEYGFIISLIVLVVIGTIQLLGLDLGRFYSEKIIEEIP